MSNATELLNGMTEEQVAAYSANPDTEPHIVIGSNRIITVPAALKKIAVQHDHNVETVTFDCPRYWDEHDMSKWKVYINYILSNGYDDSYLADDVVVDDTNKSIMHFSWTISRNVTQIKGTITILVCIKELDADGNEIRHWNSERNSELTVSAGMKCTEQVVDDNPDIVDQLLEKMAALEKKINDLNVLPEVTDADNGKTAMVVDGVWQPVVFPAGTQYDPLVITIPASSWVDNGSQINAVYSGLTKNVDGCHIHTAIAASSTPAQYIEATKCGVYRSGATGKQLTFTAASSMPTIDLVFDVLITKPTTLSYSMDQEGLVMTIMEE